MKNLLVKTKNDYFKKNAFWLEINGMNEFIFMDEYDVEEGTEEWECLVTLRDMRHDVRHSIDVSYYIDRLCLIKCHFLKFNNGIPYKIRIQELDGCLPSLHFEWDFY